MLVHPPRGPRTGWRRSRHILAGAAVLASAFAIPQAAHAAVTLSPDQSIVWTEPLADVTPNQKVDDRTIYMFLERSGEMLQLPLKVDVDNTTGIGKLYGSLTELPQTKPEIPADEVVNSYLLHADAVDNPTWGPKLNGTVTFDEEILGVMMTSATLVGSDAQVGHVGTRYLDGPQGRRGLEMDPSDPDASIDNVHWVDAHTLRVRFNINTVVDEVRIITRAAAALPEPAPGDPTSIPDSGPGISLGYRFVASDGGVFSFNRPFYGSTGGIKLNQPIVVGSETSTSRGYWLVGRDGGVFSFGDAKFHGSTGAVKLNQPIVTMAATPDDGGYWLFAADGGVFSFGNAQFYGSAPAGKTKLAAPVVAAAPAPDGKGYWIATADGRVLNYGSAGSYGSATDVKLAAPIVAMTSTASGNGYWLLGQDGGIFSYGDAAFHGSTGGMKLNQPVVAMQPTPTGKGYWLVATDGGVFSFGDATFLGSTGNVKLAKPIVGVL